MKNDHVKKLLQEAVPPVEDNAAPDRDLWPAVLLRLNSNPTAANPQRRAGFPAFWFDAALAAGMVALVALFPAAIPVLLYYL